MRTLSRHAAVLAVLALTIAGCGGSDGSSDDVRASDEPTSSATPTTTPGEPTVDAATGDTIEGKGYSFQPPEGWQKPDKEIPGTEQADTFAADLDDKDGFADNINVVIQDPTPGELSDGIEDSLSDQLTSGGAKDVEAQDRTTVAGDEAVHITSAQSTNLSDQYFVVHDDVLYVITLSYSTSVPPATQDDTAASILSTWKWAA